MNGEKTEMVNNYAKVAPELRIIGEGTIDYCARLNHKFKLCKNCKKETTLPVGQ